MVLNTSLRGVTCLASDFHSLSFQPQRRGVEKSPPSMLHAPMRKEISRLRVSIEHSPISSHRHAAPLEMTRRRGSIGSWEKETDSKSTAPPSTCHPERQRRILVHGAGVPMVLNTSLRGVTCLASDFHPLSFQPQRRGRGEISPINAACPNEAGDFSAQSFNRAQPHFLIPSCGSARNDTAAGRLHFFRNKKTATESIHDSFLEIRNQRITVPLVSLMKRSTFTAAAT